MDYFKRSFRFRLMDRPQRPLLYAAGAAEAAAGHRDVYGSSKGFYEEKTASMKVSSPDPSSKSVEGSLAEARWRNKQAMEEMTQLERTNSNLMSKVTALQEELSRTRGKWKDQIRVCDQESGAYNIFKEHLVEPQTYERAVEKIIQLEKRNTFLASKLITLQLNFSETQVKWKEQIRETKREQESCAKLELQCKEMEETLQQRQKVSLAEAERISNNPMDSSAQLEIEKTELMSQVNTLRGSVQQLEEELSETRAKEPPAERQGNEPATDKVTQLQQANSFLTSKLISLQLEFSETRVRWKEQIKETKREQESRARLELRCKEMEETLQQRLKVSLAEAEQKYSEATESSARLENEKTKLMFQVDTMRGSVQQLEEELSETQAKSDALKALLSQTEMKHDEAILSSARLESETSDLMSKVEELEGSMQEMSKKLSEMHNKCVEATKECERKDQELRLQMTRSTLMQSELEQKQISLAEAERKYTEVMECSAELQEENRYLLSVVDALRRSELLEKRRSETCMQSGQTRESKKEVQGLPLSMEHLTSPAETEMLYKQAIKSSAFLEKERRGLKFHLQTLRDTVKDLEEMLAHAEKKCETIKEERDQEHEVHRILKIQHKILQDRLTQCAMLLRVHGIDFETKENVAL